MKILVDADACPVVEKIESVAKKYNVSVVLFSDTCHQMSSDYSEIRTVDKGPDSVDFAILKECNKGDVVVTGDYGLAAMVLGKQGKAIHHCGREYTSDNIDGLLLDRYIAKKERFKQKRRVKSTRREKVEGGFINNLERIIKNKQL